jgi:type 1 glutamine amidotransferase
VLVLCDDYWHPARVVRAGLHPLNNNGFEFDWIENGHEFSAERLADYPVVVFSKMNHISAADQQPWITDEVQAAFREHVEQGKGLLVIHSGTALFGEAPVLQNLIGGSFATHPPQCPVTVEPYEGHSLTSGSTAFTLPDEHYFMTLDDDQVDIFLTTVSEHGRQPGGWARTIHGGRVCVLAPGHNLEVWLHPSYQSLIYNALRWCGETASP